MNSRNLEPNRISEAPNDMLTGMKKLRIITGTLFYKIKNSPLPRSRAFFARVPRARITLPPAS